MLETSSCIDVHRASQSSKVVLLGESVTVTLSVSILCAGISFPDDQIIVAGKPARWPWSEARGAARVLSDTIPLVGEYPVGIVGLADRGNVPRCVPKARNLDLAACLSAVGGLSPNGWEDAIDGARRSLGAAIDPTLPIEVHKLRLWLLSDDTLSAKDCDDIAAVLPWVQRGGVLVGTACATPGCGSRCMDSLASIPDLALGHVDGPLFCWKTRPIPATILS